MDQELSESMQLFSKEGPEKEFYWALVLEPDWVQAGIWSVVENKAQIISISPPIIWGEGQDLLGAVDTSLSAAVQNLPENFGEPAKTVFGVPAFWVEGGQIKEEHLNNIKEICNKLALEPTGFVVLPEAVAYLIKSEEGAPLSAIVVGIGKEFLEISLFKTGKIVETVQVIRSVSIFADLKEGLSRFSGIEALPSRIIVYDGKEGELEAEKQSLINAEWDNLEKVKFYHTPQVEILTPEKKVLAVALAGGTEIGGIKTVEIKKNQIDSVIPREEPAVKELDFVINEDIVQTKTPNREIPASPLQSLPFQKIKFNLLRRFWGGFLEKMNKIREKIKLGQIGGLLLALAILGFGFWWFYPKAEITIYVSPKKFEEKLGLTIDSDLPGKVLTTEVSGDQTKATTGRKKVGEKARGSVKIQNGTAANLNLKAGTVLLAANDLKFTLDEPASVSAALSPSLPGTQVVNVTAYDIGAEYNLAKDESFKVANYPKAEVDAQAVSAFSGGSSRDISAVSPEDQKTLEESLIQELTEIAKKNLLRNLSSEEIFIDSSLETTILSRVFSNKVGDEAENLKLTVSLRAKGFSVARGDLVALSQKTLEENIPAGFILRDDQLSFEFEPGESDEEKKAFSLRIIANFLPKVNRESIIKQIRGKSPTSVQGYLTSIPGFSRAEISIKPLFPGRLGVIPRISKNISLEVMAEQ